MLYRSAGAVISIVAGFWPQSEALTKSSFSSCAKDIYTHTHTHTDIYIHTYIYTHIHTKKKNNNNNTNNKQKIKREEIKQNILRTNNRQRSTRAGEKIEKIEHNYIHTLPVAYLTTFYLSISSLYTNPMYEVDKKMILLITP